MSELKYKSKADAIRNIFGIYYYNARMTKLLDNYLIENNLQLPDIIENKFTKCKYCGKEIKKARSFCSQSCCAKYNNTKRIISEETKRKIAETLKNKTDCERNENGRKVFTYICKQCGKQFKTIHKNITYCSKQCSQSSLEVIEKQRQKRILLIKQGKHKGWQSRNITSYAEKFWIKVLDNNNIQYIREDHSNKKYFLDFLIEKNGKKIDLEIDGKQHKYKDRKESDKIRDTFLSDLGYIIYRIDWNEVKTDKGKQEMNNKINSFLSFYNSI